MAALTAGWFAAHKAVVLAGAGAVGLGLYSKKKAAGGTGPTAAAGNTSTPVGAAVNATYDSTAQDVYSSIEPQLGVLQTQIANLSAPATDPAILASLAKISTDTGEIRGNAVNQNTVLNQIGASVQSIGHTVAPNGDPGPKK